MTQTDLLQVAHTGWGRMGLVVSTGRAVFAD